MGLQDDFVNAVTGCMSIHPFPPITAPGLSNFALACFLSTLAPINYILGFIPPSPSNPPSFPSISMCVTPFLGAMIMPPSFPGANISLGGITVPIPGVGSAPYQRDVSGQLKMAACGIALPFLLIKKMITDLLNLQLNLPTLSGITTLLASLMADVGISGVGVLQFAHCLPIAVFNLFTALI